jgi:hypothetical protein
LDPDVVGPVSVDIDDLSVEGAVKSVLRHAQTIAPLQSSIDNGVYIVFPEMHARGG